VRALILTLPLVVVGLSTWWVLGESTPKTLPDAGVPQSCTAIVSREKLNGATSCAAAACHNSNDFRQTKGNEYSIWATHDPHAQAYATLLKPESKEMVHTLHLKAAHEEQRCLACHGFDIPPNWRGEKLAKEAVREGVSCEQCHGGSEHWRSTHYTTDTSRNGEEQKAKGMTATKDLATRVQVCASCHIGGENREVNHDLIAAGHPRLLFEYTAYHDLMPRHWFEGGLGTDFEARAWLIGQIASARAAVKLLQVRARRAATNEVHAVWPEFAETSCYACHHDLEPNSWRQQSGFDGRKPGEMPWNGWYTAMPKALLRINAPVPKPAAIDAQIFDDLANLMRRPSPDAAAVVKAATEVLANLEQWLNQLQSTSTLLGDHGTVGRLTRRLIADATAGAEKAPPGQGTRFLKNMADWDHATQTYLAIVALRQAENDLRANPVSPHPPREQEDIRKFLEFGRRYDSPRDFTPSQFSKKLRAWSAPEQ